jgi:hypothetical protein
MQLQITAPRLVRVLGFELWRAAVVDPLTGARVHEVTRWSESGAQRDAARWVARVGG